MLPRAMPPSVGAPAARNRGWAWAVGLAGLLAGTGCASLWRETASLQGTVTYRERIALPAEAVLEVELIETAAPGGVPKVVGRTRQKELGQVPVFYELNYPESAIRSGRAYRVEARILVEGRPWMVTWRVSTVTDGNRIARADVLLRRAEGL